MSRNYKFHNPEGVYFVSFAVVEWLDIFSYDEYRNIILENLQYCQGEKGMEIFAWCIMPSHVHLVFRSLGSRKPGLLLGDFKRVTSKSIVKALIENKHDFRNMLLLTQFRKSATHSSNVDHYQFWQHDNHPIELWSNRVIDEKIDYIHQNPVKAGLVFKAEDYPYSSAVDYVGKQGLLNDLVVIK